MSEGRKVPTQAVMPYAARVLERLVPYVQRAKLAGSLRRLQPQVSDIEIVAEPNVTQDLLGTERPDLEPIHLMAKDMGTPTKLGEKFIQVPEVLDSGLTLDLFLVTPPADWGVIYTIRTGPADFSRELVTRLPSKGWRCRKGRVLDDDSRHVPCPTEQEVFEACGVEWLPPEKRSVSALH